MMCVSMFRRLNLTLTKAGKEEYGDENDLGESESIDDDDSDATTTMRRATTTTTTTSTAN